MRRHSLPLDLIERKLIIDESSGETGYGSSPDADQPATTTCKREEPKPSPTLTASDRPAPQQSPLYSEETPPKESDEETEYEVEAIVGYRSNILSEYHDLEMDENIFSTDDYYLIKWKGCDEYGKPWEDSWVPAANISHMFEDINEFRERMYLEPLYGPVFERAGCSVSPITSTTNWATAEQAVEAIQKMELRYPGAIDSKILDIVAAWPKPAASRATIYVFRHRSHLYALLSSMDFLIIADGGNSFKEDITLHKKLATIYGRLPAILLYDVDNRTSYCASECAQLARHLAICYKRKNFTHCRPNRQMKKVPETELHKTIEPAISNTPLAKRFGVNRVACLTCKKEFKKQYYNLHARRCTGASAP